MAKQVHVYKVNAFSNSNNGTGGNGAGVVLETVDLADKKMQQIAARVGYSETAFVTTKTEGEFRLRFFTPTSEVDLCGHATLAAGVILKYRNKLHGTKARVIVNAGQLTLETREDGKVFIELPKPELREEFDGDRIANILGVSKEQIKDSGFQPRVVEIGTRQLMIPLANRNVLINMKPNLSDMAIFNQQTQTMGMHVFSLDTQEGGIDAVCRSFSPMYGIDEESATGGASGALGFYLATFHKQKTEYTFLQGITMPNPSRITVAINVGENKPLRVQVGGYATIIGEELVT